jgi:hypothetical protein
VNVGDDGYRQIIIPSRVCSPAGSRVGRNNYHHISVTNSKQKDSSARIEEERSIQLTKRMGNYSLLFTESSISLFVLKDRECSSSTYYYVQKKGEVVRAICTDFADESSENSNDITINIQSWVQLQGVNHLDNSIEFA